MARVDVLYRRVEMSTGFADSSHANVITSGEFELNMRNRTLTKNGIPIELTQVEFQIMEYFSQTRTQRFRERIFSKKSGAATTSAKRR